MGQLKRLGSAPQALFVPPLPRACPTKAPLEPPAHLGYRALVRARLAARRSERRAS